jgi:hypothetical protein
MDELKNGSPGAKRKNYILELTAERLSGRPTEHYVNFAMERGTEMEPYARSAYEAKTGAIVAEQGFIHHPTLEWVGGSVDGFIDDDGIIEIKSPTSQTHVSTLLTRDCSQHYPQIMGYLWITGRKYCDFISYDDRLPAPYDLYIQRVERDDEFIGKLQDKVISLLAEVAANVASLQSKPPEHQQI